MKFPWREELRGVKAWVPRALLAAPDRGEAEVPGLSCWKENSVLVPSKLFPPITFCIKVMSLGGLYSFQTVRTFASRPLSSCGSIREGRVRKMTWGRADFLTCEELCLLFSLRAFPLRSLTKGAPKVKWLIVFLLTSVFRLRWWRWWLILL